MPCRTGEGPLWHPEESAVYWMDIPNGHLFRYGTGNGKVIRVLDGPVLGAAALQRDGGIALFGGHGGIWMWAGELHTVSDETAGVRGTRFNDAIADPTGRVLSGTMPTVTAPSVLHAIEPNGEARVVVEGLGQSNGMALSHDGRTLFHVDTKAGLVRAFDYDVDTGCPRSPHVITRFPSTEGVPDGLAMDEEGSLWVAMWGGGCVLRVNATGRIIGKLVVPTPLVSSVAFGGAELSDLFITTAGGDNRRQHGLLAGSLFHAAPGVRGLERHRSALTP